jgi:hypothetical protein
MGKGDNEEDFFEGLENQTKDTQGGDKLTDAQRSLLREGVGRDNLEEAVKIFGRQQAELMAEQNPKGLPLIFKPGYVVRVLNEEGIVEEDWKVDSWNKSGWVKIIRRVPREPGDDPRPGMGRQSAKILYFKEFYELNPPDESCQNAEHLGEYRKSKE